MSNKTNPKRSTTIVQDELALAKSTAWAWYERGSGSGSGSDARVTREPRSKSDPKPSRYKLEAMRNKNIVHQEAANSETSATKVSTKTTRTNSLLDQYEIERISRHLDCYIRGGAAAFGGSGGDVAVVKNNKAVVQRRKNMGKGFWLGHVPACGSSRDDVVDFAFSRRPEKGGGVAVVEVGGCRPRHK